VFSGSRSCGLRPPFRAGAARRARYRERRAELDCVWRMSPAELRHLERGRAVECASPREADSQPFQHAGTSVL